MARLKPRPSNHALSKQDFLDCAVVRSLCMMVPGRSMGVMAIGVVVSPNRDEASLRGRGQSQGCGD